MAFATKAAAKVAGLAKGTAKALAGYPGIFHHLAGEHAEVSMLMKRLASASQESSLRDELFPEIRKSLLAHAHAEEKEFYPPLLRIPELEDLVSRCLSEHERVEGYLEQLASGNKKTKTWTEVFGRLMRAVEGHVEREESELFPKAVELITDKQAERIGERYEKAEQREKSHL